VESPQVNVSRSRTPPVGKLTGWSAYEHLSPQRGIWCSNQLNTNGAHGIPSELSLTTARGDSTRMASQDAPGEGSVGAL
jgi:hypothetical protein